MSSFSPADKIKQIKIKIEIEDGNDAKLEWSRSCSAIGPFYIHGGVTVGDCYELYELLKGRKYQVRIHIVLIVIIQLKSELGSASVDITGKCS